ncbi:hypothetical protein HPP92_015581 [Vanilla planifolia]|uniref:Uncharacterized protein n=1 Tax=Vanilla planifolia TaxID=51239 RepID=A0A835QD97_VANPL|nr:hypothetical protein HPP92_015581 [Vanilla planifolia]
MTKITTGRAPTCREVEENVLPHEIHNWHLKKLVHINIALKVFFDHEVFNINIIKSSLES